MRDRAGTAVKAVSQGRKGEATSSLYARRYLLSRSERRGDASVPLNSVPLNNVCSYTLSGSRDV